MYSVYKNENSVIKNKSPNLKITIMKRRKNIMKSRKDLIKLLATFTLLITTLGLIIKTLKKKNKEALLSDFDSSDLGSEFHDTPLGISPDSEFGSEKFKKSDKPDKPERKYIQIYPRHSKYHTVQRDHI